MRVRAFSSYLNTATSRPSRLDATQIQASRRISQQRDLVERARSYTQANGRVVTITMYGDGSQEEIVEREGDTVTISGQRPDRRNWR